MTRGAMEGTDGDGDRLEKAWESDCSFVWDESSNLYFHASSGFYHDPNAGWYYNSIDGRYYKFENGTYMPLTYDEDEKSEHQNDSSLVRGELTEDQRCNEEHFSGNELENQQPPSDWLEETLINIYLSGNSHLYAGGESSGNLDSNEEEKQCLFSCERQADQVALEELHTCHRVDQVEGKWVPEDVQVAPFSTDISSSEDTLVDEEKWQGQYGQVVRVSDEDEPCFPVTDLWDWEMVVETVKKRHNAARLSGRLVKRSSKLHPSVPSGSGIMKTAPIRSVHLDLVRVASGKVYRLRTPNKRYLDALSEYDSSNPTKNWDFPDLFIIMHNTESDCYDQICGTNRLHVVTREEAAAASGVDHVFQKIRSLPYRDRAAERRNLHGEFSIGPGQKNFSGSTSYEEESTSHTYDPEEAAAEAMNMTFGKGSFARRVLEKMGWKDGEALGSTNKGILEPLQAVANKGNAGLGWNHIR